MQAPVTVVLSNVYTREKVFNATAWSAPSRRIVAKSRAVTCNHAFMGDCIQYVRVSIAVFKLEFKSFKRVLRLHFKY